MSKSKHATMNNVVQFRTGEWTGGKLEGLAIAWKLTRHEAARRLMLLAMYRLNLDHYPAIERLEKAIGGGQAFLRACDRVGAALAVSEAARRERLDPPLTEPQRVEFLEEWSKRSTDVSHGLPGELREAGATEFEKSAETSEPTYRKIRRQGRTTPTDGKDTASE
jgi:hypothetical protein